MARYMTAQRKQLLAFLQANPDRLFSPREIAAALQQEQAVSLSAVYRNLAFLEQSGAVGRVAQAPGREALYRSLASAACRGFLHMTCTVCGQTAHVNAAAAEQLLRTVLTADGFYVDKAHTTLYGLCQNCRNAAAASR